jgi:serine/threonine-protein kinase
MGEVYRARDTKLDRDVALKVLPDHLIDADRLARLTREAQIVASLSHPNIAAIHGLEQLDGSPVLVLELVEGPTLADRIAQGPIPQDEVFSFARQIAEALEAAHEQGVVHRDLKPGNVKLRPDGLVKVLDFGLAKLTEAAGPGSGTALPASMSPTMLSPAKTIDGVILGTAAYMSPEQARGKVVDRRADIWAFGCVLFEMLTGRPAFEGETVSDIVAAVLKNEPDWSLLPADVPARLRTLLRRCLRKDPGKRLPHIGLVRFELEDVTSEPATDVTRSDAKPLWRRMVPLVGTAMVAGLLVAGAMWWRIPATAPAPLLRFQETAPGPLLNVLPSVGISADGTRLAFVSNGRLYTRLLSERDPVPIPGTDHPPGGYVGNPVFSPDDAVSLVYWSGNNDAAALYRVRLGGGSPVRLTPDLGFPMGTTWDEHGIVFAHASPGRTAAVMRLRPDNLTPELLFELKTGDVPSTPQLLPGGRAVLFTLLKVTSAQSFSQERWDRADVLVQDLESGRRQTIVNGSAARYLPTGHLIYAIGSTFSAAPFDLARLKMTPPPVPVLEGVMRTGVTNSVGHANVAFSASGTVVYAPTIAEGLPPVALAIIGGNQKSIRLNISPGRYDIPRLDPSGRRLAVDRDGQIWIYDLSGASDIKLLTFEGTNRYPALSHDATYVAFQSNRDGDVAIWRQRTDGSAPAEKLTNPKMGTTHRPASWSPDGKTLLFVVQTSPATSELWTLQDGKEAPFGGITMTGPFALSPAFSPDGHWVAYTAPPTGVSPEFSVFVTPFPSAPGVRHQVGGGIHPMWSRDGSAIYVNNTKGLIKRRVVSTQPFLVGAPEPVTEWERPDFGPVAERGYDILPDGRIVGLVAAETGGTPTAAPPPAPKVEVMLNWFDELKRLVPVN